MGNIQKILAERNTGGGFYEDKVRLEIEECIHLHYRDLRLTLNGKDFLTMCKIFKEAEKKYKAEVNSLMVEFNKTAKNNFDLMEEKVAEIKNLLRLTDDKMDKINKMEIKAAETKKDSNPDNIMKLPVSKKSTIIKKLIAEGKSSSNISKIMGISKAEVDIYLNLLKK